MTKNPIILDQNQLAFDAVNIMEKSNVTPLVPKDKTSKENEALVSSLSPREIVSELDRFIIGQKDAKRAVAVALRNRWRRKKLPENLREDVYPKNILMTF